MLDRKISGASRAAVSSREGSDGLSNPSGENVSFVRKTGSNLTEVAQTKSVVHSCYTSATTLAHKQQEENASHCKTMLQLL